MKVLRKCKDCGLEAHSKEDLDLFVKGSGREKYGHRNKCRSCNAKIKKINYGSRYHSQSRYGISYEEYNKRMATSVCCEICGKEDNLVYDHNHTTKEFRGVLCRSCNAGLGHLKDSPIVLENALAYLLERGHYGSE